MSARPDAPSDCSHHAADDIHGDADLASLRRIGQTGAMGRRDYFDDPAAPAANSVVPSVVAMVRDDAGRVLMIHRTDNDLWALPGGGHDIGESIRQTVIREVEEETGVVVDVERVTGIYTDPHHVIAYDNGEVRQQFSICFTAKAVGGTPRPSSESREVRWVAMADLDQLAIHPSMRLRIEHALADRTEPYVG